MLRIGVALCLSSVLLPAAPSARAEQTPQAVIDCDAGGDLARDLPRAVAAGHSTIFLRGTCTGNFEIDLPGLQLRGDPSATIRGEDTGGFPAAIRVVGPIDLVLRNLEIRDGYFGVRVENSGANVQILDSVLRDNSVGLMAERGAEVRLFGSEVRDSVELGLLADSGSRLSVQQSLVQGNPTGIVAREGATLFCSASEISGNAQVGIEVRQLATASLVGTQLSNNGEAHVYGTDRTLVNIRFDSIVGNANDQTLLAVFVEDTSELQIGSGTMVWGEVVAWSARVRVFAATLHERLTLERFSDGIVQSNATVDGGILCRTGSDALCPGAAGTATDCPSAPADCSLSTSSEGSVLDGDHTSGLAGFERLLPFLTKESGRPARASQRRP